MNYKLYKCLICFFIQEWNFVAYSFQGSQTGQLNICNWLADGSRLDNVISITLQQI